MQQMNISKPRLARRLLISAAELPRNTMKTGIGVQIRIKDYYKLCCKVNLPCF